MEPTGVEITTLKSALDVMQIDIGRYPTTQEGLTALKVKPPTAENWNGPYVKNTTSLNDPWGNPYTYVSPGRHGDFDLSSNGPDGATGNGAEPPVRSW